MKKWISNTCEKLWILEKYFQYLTFDVFECIIISRWLTMVERKEYLEELKRWKEKDLIKVVTGIRRCGKSTLFDLFIDYLKSIGVS